LPSDWSSYKFLVIEVKSSTAQRFLLRIYTDDGMLAMRFHQFGGGVWIRAAVPLSYFQSQSQEGQDLAAVFNKPRNPFWMVVVGPFGPIKAVQSLAVAMVAPVGNPTLDIRSVRLSNEDPGSEILDKLPVVDEFGQWIPAKYPGKVKSLEQLKADWDREDKSLNPGEFGYCKYGGFANTKAKASFASSRSTASGGSSIPTDTCSCPWVSMASGPGEPARALPAAKPTTPVSLLPTFRPEHPGAAPRRETFTDGTWRDDTAPAGTRRPTTWPSDEWKPGV
jgi:hypothetical protein